MIEAFEPVGVRSRPELDEYGHPQGGGSFVTVTCRVQPLILDQDAGQDREGSFTQLRVFAPAGTVVDADSEVLIRGEVYSVVEPPHDFSAFRRPWLRSHSPSVVFTCQRGVG